MVIGLAGLVGTRSCSTTRVRLVITFSVLGWCAGWLWSPGGLVVAGIMVVTGSTAVALQAGNDRRTTSATGSAIDDPSLLAPLTDRARPASWGRTKAVVESRAAVQRVARPSIIGGWLAVVSIGAFWTLVAGATLHGP
jgi:hypothetical protein